MQRVIAEARDGESMNKYEKLVVFISVFSLLLTICNIYLIYLTYQTRMASLQFQSMVYNFTSVITADADYAFLGKPSEYLSYDNTIERTTHYGYLEVDVTVITPHYGTMSIRIRSFNVGESPMLDSEKRNQTEVAYASGEDEYEYTIDSGSNHITAQLHLRAIAYPNSQNLPPQGESVQFILGRLNLEAELFDIQTQQTSTREFYGIIVVIMEVLP